MTPTEEGSKEGVSCAGGPMLPFEQEVARGLHFTHIMVLAMQQQANETVRFIEALTRLLAARGIASDAEWADALENLRKDSTRAGLVLGSVPQGGFALRDRPEQIPP